jgi:hypothetical protein
VSQQNAIATAEQARVHITSSPTGGEIYIDGKFVGNTPSEIAVPAGEHVFKVTFKGREWTRTVRITGGEISLNAEIPPEQNAAQNDAAVVFPALADRSH